jgi:23S rRNA pseudouridine2605 synthase
MSAIRLQKFMAECGIASRRKCEEYITSGLVKVNGRKVVELGIKVDPLKDKVLFLNKKVMADKKIYIILNKPKDYISTKNDPKFRKTIYELLPKEYESLHSVGRLDRNSTGLLLVTNDGELTNALLHPKKKIIKIYRVTIDNVLTKKAHLEFESGVILDGKKTMPAKCFLLDDTGKILEVHIAEGRNRQIRRMFESLGFEVKRLKRIAVGPLSLGKLRLGEYRELSLKEVKKLKELK